MSYIVSGSTWAPLSATQHAQNILAAINTTLAPLSITIAPSVANVIWLFCLGMGAVASLFDTVLSAAKNSFSPSLCDDAQVLSLLPITGLTRLPATYSTLVVLFTAAGSDLTVPAGTHVKITNQSVLFITSLTTVVPANTQVAIDTVCDTSGPVQVAAGQATSVSETLSNLASVTNSATAVVGRAIETVSALRTRIISGMSVLNNLDGFTMALRALPGISQAVVWFNASAVAPLVLPGGITVPIRTLYIVVAGSSTEIAITWANSLMAPTYGTQTQTYVTQSGQNFTMYYANAVTSNIYVKVYVSSVQAKQAGYATLIKDTVAALSSASVIGQTITQDFVLLSLSSFNSATINGATVSNDNVTFDRTCSVPANGLPTFLSANVTVIEEP